MLGKQVRGGKETKELRASLNVFFCLREENTFVL